MDLTDKSDLLSNFMLESIHRLREVSISCESNNNEHIVNGLYFSWDDEMSNISLRTESNPDALLNIKAEVSGRPRWMSLNFALGVGAVEQGDTLCVVLDASAKADSLLSIFMRSRSADRVEDLDWEEQINLTSQRQIAVAFCKVPPAETVLGEYFRTLVVRLPLESFQICIHDLRLFTIHSDHYASTLGTSLGTEN